MFNLLIVDDELHVVKGLLADLDADQLELSNVFTAHNIRQAKNVLNREAIDIMISDIEMPQGSGLELLEWANEQLPQLQTIFLTSYADFHYAKQAIRLGGLEYLLKPVPDEDLKKAIEKAKERILRLRKSSAHERFWNYNMLSVIEHFWTELLQGKIAPSPAAVQIALETRNLPYTKDTLFLPVLIGVRRWHKPLSARDEKLMEYALKNSGTELILGEELSGQIMTMDRGCLLLVITYEQLAAEAVENELLLERCENYVEACRRYFYCDLSCYIGYTAKADGMEAAFSQLQSFERNNVVYDHGVFRITGAAPLPKSEVPMPDMSVWANLLKNGMKDRVVKEIREYLEERVACSEVHAMMLQQFHENFLQTVYFVLWSKGRLAHELFSDSDSMEMSRNAVKSVANMLRWVEHVVCKAISQEKAELQHNQVVANIKQYITAHLDESNLSRKEIAQHAFLNPDYLARLFKKETGLSMMEYLLQERIKLAQELLLSSNLSVAEIASSVGYSHLSHFSRMFKKQTGVNPNEFRQQT
ncbi:helix-turn-helix domain-containing protein [Paenibacillus sanguinis]|uniref:helix-turn-helix domain-containing protein n=1 Tax=Paenibacillus sanguinis TaxID=225906 RepID=UPI000373425F|nr:helix-turn-helix domain-containing protein [Paenibacillus sanguinis]